MVIIPGLVHSGLRYLPDVVTLVYEADRCNGCRSCVDVCPHAVFELRDKRARLVDRDACMECGACALNCPEGAITVDAGVGCASAVIAGAVRGTEPTCGCTGSDSDGASCC
jgi:NAD-dependent dihydropyrimidine dehydrogenase PreA subunit